jgi:UDP-GlcNAc3NAcA epimerase
MSDVLYCPTDTAVKNLEAEGFNGFKSRVIKVGDVMYDSVLHFRSVPGDVVPKSLPERFALCTVHRAENVDDPVRLRSIFDGIDEIAKELDVVVPIHPRTRNALLRFGIDTRAYLIEPVGYVEMLNLIARSSLVLTDSGGLQKEAFFLGKYCLTLRDTTEWTELVDAGVNVLVGANRDRLLIEFRKSLMSTYDFSAQPYGSGNAGELIAADLTTNFA